MASLSSDVKGNRKIQFTAKDGARRTLYLGKLPKRQAEGIKVRIEQLVSAAVSGFAVDDETTRWLGERDQPFLDRLAKVGLIPKRELATIAGFTEAYITGRSDVKPATVINLRRARHFLLKFFKTNPHLRAITSGDADEFQRWVHSVLGENTARRICGRAKQFFRAAMRKKLITENPFVDLKGTGLVANRERDYFLSREDAAKVLDACPTAQWRLIFALSRFAGLRCPSEHLQLTWADIDWANQRMRVKSPKTEGHAGHESRIVPLFSEFLPYLEAAYEEAKEGDIYVISIRRNAATNLRSQLKRIIEKAGLKVWPKLFQTLRASRATELAQLHPGHVAAEWLGHSQLTAQKHYWRVTEDDFAKALKTAENLNSLGLENRVANTDALPAKNVLQIAAQQPAVLFAEVPQESDSVRQNRAILHPVRTICGLVNNLPVPSDGLEPSTL